MKCIKLVTGEVIRVKDYKAGELVCAKKGNYCPKHVWKKFKKDERK